MTVHVRRELPLKSLLDGAPEESQDALREFGRPECERWLAQFPHVPKLDAKAIVEAYRIWDTDIGARKTK